MNERGYVEMPVLRWLSGHGSRTPGDTGLGWTYRGEAEMAAFERPLEDPPVLAQLAAQAGVHVGMAPQIIEVYPFAALSACAACTVAAKNRPVAIDSGGHLQQLFATAPLATTPLIKRGWYIRARPAIPSRWQ